MNPHVLRKFNPSVDEEQSRAKCQCKDQNWTMTEREQSSSENRHTLNLEAYL